MLIALPFAILSSYNSHCVYALPHQLRSHSHIKRARTLGVELGVGVVGRWRVPYFLLLQQVGAPYVAEHRLEPVGKFPHRRIVGLLRSRVLRVDDRNQMPHDHERSGKRSTHLPHSSHAATERAGDLGCLLVGHAQHVAVGYRHSLSAVEAALEQFHRLVSSLCYVNHILIARFLLQVQSLLFAVESGVFEVDARAVLVALLQLGFSSVQECVAVGRHLLYRIVEVGYRLVYLVHLHQERATGIQRTHIRRVDGNRHVEVNKSAFLVAALLTNYATFNVCWHICRFHGNSLAEVGYRSLIVAVACSRLGFLHEFLRRALRECRHRQQ